MGSGALLKIIPAPLLHPLHPFDCAQGRLPLRPLRQAQDKLFDGDVSSDVGVVDEGVVSVGGEGASLQRF